MSKLCIFVHWCSLVLVVQSTNYGQVSTEYSTENCTIAIHKKRCDDCFQKYCNKSCKILNIISDELEVIPTGISCFKNLLELNARNMKITKLEGFQTDMVLKFLNLSKNKIGCLNVDDFVGLTKLERLLLAENELTILNPEYFNGLNKLTELDLSSNKIANLPLSIFDLLTSLEVFKMKDNQLKTLVLSNNRRDSFSIKILDLSNNNLTKVGNLMDFSNLEQLDLSDNPNLKWNSMLFSQTKKIVHLTLNNANLSARNIPLIKSLDKLQRLSIADNNLKELNVSMLPHLEYLQYLNLKQRSTIKLLDHTVLKQLFPNLRTIKISGHGWSCEYQDDIISYLHKSNIEWPDESETIRSSKCKTTDKLKKSNTLRMAGIAVFSITLILIVALTCYLIQKKIKQKEIRRFQAGVVLNQVSVSSIDPALQVVQADDMYLLEPMLNLDPTYETLFDRNYE